MVQAMQDEEEAAEASLRRGAADPAWHRDATTRLAALLGESGRERKRGRSWKRRLARRPAPISHGLGESLLQVGLARTGGRSSTARRSGLKPGDAMAHFNLGNACEELHDTAGARQSFARAAELRPEKRLWRLRAEICGPVVFEERREIEEYCERVEEGRRVEHRYALTPCPSPGGRGE